jgi:type IV pilus assembly protein PilM
LCHRPEVFATAIGLALTALQRDGHSLQNIRPQRKRAPWMLSLGRRKAVRTAWGIDAGSSSMKIVELRILDGDKLRIERCWLRAINVASANRTPSFRNEELKRALEELDDNWKSRPDRVCLGMSSSATLMRRLRLPPMKDKQFRSAVQFEAQQVFPVPLDELYWDYQECPCDPPGTGGRHVLVLAARKPAVDLLLEPFDRQKLEVDVVQSGPLALQNLFSFETEADSKSQEPAGTTGILDLGAAASSLLALGNKTLWHRSLAACGDRLTSRIAQQLQLTREQAETLKHDVRRARDLHPLFAVIDPVIDDLRAELQRTLEAYLRDEPAQPLQQLILVGGAAGLHGLLRQLWFGGFGLAES